MSWLQRKRKKLRRAVRVRGNVGKWGWWYSSDEENYSGPYKSRDDAISEAIGSCCGEMYKAPGCFRFYLLEARQGPIPLWRYTDSESVMGRVMEAVDDEYGGEEGVEWDKAWPTAADRRLETWIRYVVRFWQWWYGIEVRTWGFTAYRNAECYTHIEGFGP